MSPPPLNNLAPLYRGDRPLCQAEPLYQAVPEDIIEAKFGPDHLEVATSLNNLAVLYKDTGRNAEAEPLYKRSLKINETKLGHGPPGGRQLPE